MSSIEAPNTDIEAGGRSNRRRRRRRRRRPSIAGGSETTTDGSLCFSDSDDQSGRFSEIEGVSVNPSRRGSTVSDSLSDEVDLESGEGEVKVKVHSAKEERDCRICHLNLECGAVNQEIGVAIELGCSCKGDLGAAHKQCAETWFMIRGNRTCEICGATALNVVGDRTNEPNNASATAAAASAAPLMLTEPRSFWHGRRVMNFLLGCMVFAFVISWLFHFHVLS